MAKREPTATESLLRIALGIDLVLVFFGTLVIRGLGIVDEVLVWVGGGTALVIVVALFGVIRFPAGVWLGHVFHALLLAGFLVDLAVGLSVIVPVGFWVFGVIKGAQLDGRGGRSAEASL
jgi:hypothetical protein